MRIAQIAPPWLPVPPKGYGGIEIVIYHLVERLMAAGHEVTLFASGDSQTSARLSFIYDKALGNDRFLKQNPHRLMLHLHAAFARAGEFEVIHSHGGSQALYLASLVKTPVVHTLHAPIGPQEVEPPTVAAYQRFRDQNFVSISNYQRQGIPELNYLATVYNGIDLADFSFGEGSGNYLAWLGRITAKKGIIEAFEAAKLTSQILKVAAFVDPGDKQFFDTQVAPKLQQKGVEFLGNLNKAERSAFLASARVLLFPIKWDEPFGLVMVEAMACGTPVIAFNRGSVPEVVRDGVTGFIVEPEEDATGPAASPVASSPWIIKKQGIAGLVAAVERLYAMPEDEYRAMRQACRRHAEEKFTVEKMVDGYERVYRKILSGR